MRTKWPRRLAWQSAITKHWRWNCVPSTLLEKDMIKRNLARLNTEQTWELELGCQCKGVLFIWGGRNGLWTTQLIQEIKYTSQNSSFSFFIRRLSVLYSLGMPEFIIMSKWCLWTLPGNTGPRHQKLLLSWHRHSSTLTYHLIGKSWKTAAVKPHDF